MSPLPSNWSAAMYAVPGLPLVKRGTELGQLISDGARASKFSIANDDVVVVAQKIVSKAEGSLVHLPEVTPSVRAHELATATGRDPRLCEIYINESSEILGTKGRMVITRHRLGFVCTNAGVDRSNVGPGGEDTVVLLPRDPDASARAIRDSIERRIGKRVAVIISDSFGKPDREGSIGTSIGIAGIRALEVREQQDLSGRPVLAKIALVDELAAAASALMGQADELRPVVIIRGVSYTTDENSSIRQLLVV